MLASHLNRLCLRAVHRGGHSGLPWERGWEDKEDAQSLEITADRVGLSPKSSPGALGVPRPAQGVWGC